MALEPAPIDNLGGFLPLHELSLSKILSVSSAPGHRPLLLLKRVVAPIGWPEDAAMQVKVSGLKLRPQADGGELVVDGATPFIGWLPVPEAGGEDAAAVSGNIELDATVAPGKELLLVCDPGVIQDYRHSEPHKALVEVDFVTEARDLAGMQPPLLTDRHLKFHLMPFRLPDDKIRMELKARESTTDRVFPSLDTEPGCRVEPIFDLSVSFADGLEETDAPKPIEFIERRELQVVVEASKGLESDSGAPLSDEDESVSTIIGAAHQPTTVACRDGVQAVESCRIGLDGAGTTETIPIHIVLGRTSGGVMEPNRDERARVSVVARLKDGGRTLTRCSAQLRLRPADRPPTLGLLVTAVGSPLEPKSFEYPFAADALPSDLTWEEDVEFSVTPEGLAMNAQTVVRRPFLSLEANLNAGLQPGASLVFSQLDWEWTVAGHTVENEDSPISVVGAADGAGLARAGRGLKWLLKLDMGRLAAQLRDEGLPCETCLNVLLEVSDTTGLLLGRWSIARPLRWVPASSRYLGIDLGTSSTAMALAEGGDVPRLINIGNIIAMHDSDNDESSVGNGQQPFMASSVGMEARHEWRSRVAGPSLWFSFEHGFVAPEVDEIARRQRRHYQIAVPYAPANDFIAESGVVLSGPKMLLMEPRQRKSIAPRKVWHYDARNERSEWVEEVDAQALVADILHELIDFHLAWATEIEAALGASLVLTHPSRYSDRQKQALKEAAAAACRRLLTDAANVQLVPESDAVLAYLLKRDSSFEQGAGDCNLMVFDLGAGTLDLSVADSRRRGGAGVIDIARRVGAGIGGDTIDILLFFIIDALLQRLRSKDVWANYSNQVVTACAHSDESLRANLLSAKRNLARAIRRAKADLSERCRQASRGKVYGWPEGVTMDVQVGETGGGGGRRWPVTQRSSGSREQTIRLAEGVTLLKHDLQIILRLERSAVECPAMQQLMQFMTRTMVEKLVHKLPGSRIDGSVEWLMVSGRAALWPLIYEGLQVTSRELGMRFTHQQPPSAQELKQAVVMGAIEMARSGGGIQDVAEAPQRAIVAWTPTKNHFTWSVQEWVYLSTDYQPVNPLAGSFLSEVWAPPGITKEELKQPWIAFMLLEVSRVEQATLRQAGTGYEDRVRLNPGTGGVEFSSGLDMEKGTSGRPLVYPGFYDMNYDVAMEHAPPEWPASVAPRLRRPS